MKGDEYSPKTPGKEAFMNAATKSVMISFFVITMPALAVATAGAKEDDVSTSVPLSVA